jgi:signal transduction histidine kinase
VSEGERTAAKGLAFVAISAAGASATLLVSVSLGLPGVDASQLAAMAVGAALAAGAVGAAGLHLLRGRSLAAQSIVISLTAVAAVAGGALFAAQAMFFSRHDLAVLCVMLVAAGTAGTLVAVALGDRVGRASRRLGSVARIIGEGGRPGASGGGRADRPTAREFAALAGELESMSERLDQTRKRERALEASRRELVAWVSHDLRTPLAGIRAIAEALEDGVVTDRREVARYYRTLRRETDRLAGLVDDLFELSRITAGALRLELERASLGDLVSDALAAAQPIASAKGVRLEGRLVGEAPDIDLSVPEIARVFRNLLENAIRHTPSDGAVVVEAGVRGGHAEVSVEDACGGIPPQDLDRVFDLAFRGEAARTPEAHGGAGLGLAIARGIVEAHHGEILVENRGEGCRFTVRLPLAEAAR